MNQHEDLFAGSAIQMANSDNSKLRVIRQLTEALLFEGIVEYQYQQGHFQFTMGMQNYQATGKISGYSRPRLDAESIMVRKSNQWFPADLDEMITALPASEQTQQKFRGELEQTIKLCSWNAQNLSPKDRRTLNYCELESAIDEGHPYHPCFKARTGFSLKDHEMYGPENGNQFQLHWLAVRRCYLKQQLNRENDQLFWQQELGSHTWNQLQQCLTEKNGSWQEYGLLPIHPWQWNNLQNLLEHPIKQGHFLYLGAAGDFYQASISVRTLLNMSQPHKPNIKLPLNMVNTSSLRTIESHSICTAPVLSDWLTELIDGDAYLREQKRLDILPEYAGLRLTDENAGPGETWLEKLEDQISVIFRQSLELNHDGRQAIPFVALCLTEKDSKPFIEPWIKQYGCENWLNRLIETAIIPVWHLLVHHGIALEAHAQNLVLTHEQGWPKQIILRDFHESLEYVPGYIPAPETVPDFLSLDSRYQTAQPDQYYWMENTEALRELLIDTLFVFNLSDLAVLLEQHYQYSEQHFWQQVYRGFEDYKNSGYTSTERIKQIDICQPLIRTESLIRKKLSDTAGTEFHHRINNPLAETASL